MHGFLAGWQVDGTDMYGKGMAHVVPILLGLSSRAAMLRSHPEILCHRRLLDDHTFELSLSSSIQVRSLQKSRCRLGSLGMMPLHTHACQRRIFGWLFDAIFGWLLDASEQRLPTTTPCFTHRPHQFGA